MPEDIIKYNIIDVSVSDIIFPKDELRSHVSFEDLDDLAKSIRTVGLLNPITVRRAGDKFELIAGYRRLKACEIINLATVPARVIESDDSRADLQRIHENLFREIVNPVDEAHFFKKLLVKNDWRIIDLASQLHRSPSYVSKRVQLLEADPIVLEALQDGQINVTVADELNKIDDPHTRERLLYYVIQSGATVETVRRWRVEYETDRSFENVQTPTDPAQQDNAPTIKPEDIVKFSEQPQPNKEIFERVIETRMCYACLSKVEIDYVFTMFLCPDCKTNIEDILRPKTVDPEQPPPQAVDPIKEGAK